MLDLMAPLQLYECTLKCQQQMKSPFQFISTVLKKHFTPYDTYLAINPMLSICVMKLHPYLHNQPTIIPFDDTLCTM